MFNFNTCFLHFHLCAGKFFNSVFREQEKTKKTSWRNEALKVLGSNDLRLILVIFMVYGDLVEMR
jgi:hypothetical protein